MSRPFLALVAMIILAGCASQSSRPAVVAAATYKDKTYGFSFQYPASWQAPSTGSKTSVGGVATYAVALKPPGGTDQMEVTVDRDLVPYSNIAEGKIASDPNSPSLTYHYHHLTVSGWPALQVERFHGTTYDGIDTIVNTHQYSFDVKVVTGSPPFSENILAGYHMVVRSIKLPF